MKMRKLSAAFACAILTALTFFHLPNARAAGDALPDVKFVAVPGGEFRMGDGDWSSTPTHTVKITGFQMSACEITQAQYKKVTGENPSAWTESPNNPVENVSWENVQEFLKKINARNDGYAYRLPTEAEWEYASRGGSPRPYYAQLIVAAWYDANSDGKPHPVGLQKPNSWGLHDMYGNVMEWCQDWYDDEYYKKSPAADPPGPATGDERVCRGGCFSHSNLYCNSVVRDSERPDFHGGYIGFRLVRTKR
jgi:formylglycine-generating enzyme required for sulfatase activity